MLDGRVYTARFIRDKVDVLDDWMLDPYVLLYLIGTCIGDFACPSNLFALLTVQRVQYGVQFTVINRLPTGWSPSAQPSASPVATAKQHTSLRRHLSIR